MNLCQLNTLMCQNNGQCAVNISSNTTYCQCDKCHYGVLCEKDVWRGGEFDIVYSDYIASIVELCFTILNNALVFELFIRCPRIRSTNCGVYLFVYSIISLLGYILLVTGVALKYYPNQLTKDLNQNGAFLCFTGEIGSNTLFYICIWLSSLIALERGLIVRFGSKMNATRWRSIIAIIVIFIIAAAFITPMIVYKCEWDKEPDIQTLRSFFQGFSILSGIVIYIVATVLILIGFAQRIRSYGMENGPCIKTFLKLLKSHLFVFVPPITFGVCQIPFNIDVSTKNPAHSFYTCGISLGGFIMKVIIAQLTNMPYGLTWLLFVYPSRVYMTEFYLKTWSGQYLAAIIIYCRPYIDRACSTVLRIINPTL